MNNYIIIDIKQEAKDWLKDYDLENSSYNFEEGFADFAKYCVKQVISVILQKAADNAKTINEIKYNDEDDIRQGCSSAYEVYKINKESILNLQTELEKELLK